MKHRFCAAALAAVLLLSAAPLSPAASAAFSDAEGTWAAEVIEKAEGYGLMNGYPDGTFGVGKELTRGEFVAVLCRMFGWDAGSPGAPSFSACPASHWAYSYVETALAHGVMDAGGAFRPEDYISREEMAVMLVRALGYGTLAQSLSGLELPFDDITDNRGYIAIAYDIGMITGVAGASSSSCPATPPPGRRPPPCWCGCTSGTPPSWTGSTAFTPSPPIPRLISPPPWTR